MKSSPELSKILLPTFEEMMACEGPYEAAFQEETGEEAPPRSVEGGERATPEAKEEEDPVTALARILAGMRRETIAESEMMLEQARQEAVAIKKRAREETVAALRRESEATFAALRQETIAAAEAFHQAGEALYLTLEPRLFDMAMLVAERILGIALARDNEAYRGIVRNVLGQMYVGRSVVMRLPPGWYDRLMGEEGEDGFPIEMRNAGVEVVRDPSLNEGDCLVEGDFGATKGGAVTQLARIRYAVNNQQNEAGK